MTTWLGDLEGTAPDLVAVYRAYERGAFIAVRREVRRRGGAGTARRTNDQLAAVAAAMTVVVADLPEEAFGMPGGEGDWNVAQALGHDTAARAGLALAAAMAADGRWPVDAPAVVPSVPGPADATRAELLRRLATSQKLVARAAATIDGHETAPCPLEHPLVGRLRCGEWLLFAGIHDLMHLDQLHRLAADLAAPASPG